MTMEDTITDYKAYLEGLELKKQTKWTYAINLRKYMKKHNLQNKEQLQTQLTKETRTPRGLTQVYKYTGIKRPYSKNLNKTKPSTKKPKQGYDPYKDTLIQQYQKERNIKDSTMNAYYSSLAMYIPLCGFKDCKEMITEALDDEKNRVPIKEARITEHLRQYKQYLHDAPNVKSSHTLHTYFTKIETFYRHFQVTVPERPPMQIKKEYHLNYYDLPDKQMIEEAIEQSNIQLGAVIYFMTSSGTAKAETLGLTIGKFLEGLREYTNKTHPRDIIQELKGRKDLVPLIGMTRQKTNVPYYTCCSPEATYYILKYLDLQERYNPDEQLFDMKGSYLMKQFQKLNDENNWGFVGPYRRFRSHMLRKYHASNIGCSFEAINTLEGRTNGVIHETYVKQKPDELKKVYMEHMHNVMIHPERFEGPHCGGEDIKSIVKDEIQQVTNGGVVEDTTMTTGYTPQGGTGMGGGMIGFEVIKSIGRLEQRITELENRITKLGG
ncbi:hypothetical protein PXD04_10170 [Methanosphaera sp. ISO3-F5]|uniref:hypothetical protein n=1 Tax=Methanosphaera sp. ISO3-F5 TaxID=1452353 RepID=UPI002B26437A|nr:hypothetical protein [Methanosphaera sp. ISO3-F5]WQH64055.1 hypothetical protein PXD04_10170 [Methanosphaera sp. ISO3-F5]